MTRHLDELEFRNKCQVDRRNRLMKELNHLREVNQVYEVIDNEIYGADSE